MRLKSASPWVLQNVVNNQRSGLQRPGRTQGNISSDALIHWILQKIVNFLCWWMRILGLPWYKSKVNELHRENMILSKKKNWRRRT
ncbi:unnamed protein product [Lactuca virosa]|uniref:Uncharacterized protein n=1 Tax=Lactuca virosa TaxID=75947 RepID=A0AAU9MQ98_9ASTR|nr:unnamed protein product [Lactuca virosa]